MKSCPDLSLDQNKRCRASSMCAFILKNMNLVTLSWQIAVRCPKVCLRTPHCDLLWGASQWCVREACVVILISQLYVRWIAWYVVKMQLGLGLLKVIGWETCQSNQRHPCEVVLKSSSRPCGLKVECFCSIMKDFQSFLTTHDGDVTVYWHAQEYTAISLQQGEKLSHWRSAKTRFYGGLISTLVQEIESKCTWIIMYSCFPVIVRVDPLVDNSRTAAKGSQRLSLALSSGVWWLIEKLITFCSWEAIIHSFAWLHTKIWPPNLKWTHAKTKEHQNQPLEVVSDLKITTDSWNSA